MRALGQGEPVSVDQVGQMAADIGITRDVADDFLAQMAEHGPGNTIVGMLGLSLNKTGHRFTLDGRQLFTWCALDTLFLPALLGQPARVGSESPVSGARVRLTVHPGRVDAVDPAGAVVSIVVVNPDTADTSSVEAIWGTFCHHIFFFGARQEAEKWAAGRDNTDAIEILSVDDAFELGQLLSSRLLRHAGEA
jgi:alkylmercury lyase